MSYTVKQLADLAGISVRTLHYYDGVGLLKPAGTKKNGYRFYKDKELLLLQQILFFRELEFPIADIIRIMTSPDFNLQKALRDQKRFIQLKQDRLSNLIKTIDKTIKKLNHEITMEDKDLYSSFSPDEQKELKSYAAEAKERWGNTETYKESQKCVKQMTKEDWARIQKDGDELMQSLASCIREDVTSEKVQALIDKHFNNLKNFYEPSLEMYRGLAEMYVADPRFAAYYEKYATGLAQFMHDAMIAYCNSKK